jgi:hypothetical protein
VSGRDDGPSETLIVVVPDPPRRRKRRARPAPPEPRKVLTVAVPTALADELKNAVSVLPGGTLDALVAAALARVVSERGAPPSSSKRRTRAEDYIVIVP